MAIAAVCPNCEALYKLADDQAGKRVRCRGCQQPFDVPGRPSDAPHVGIHRIGRSLPVPAPAQPPALPQRPSLEALPATTPTPPPPDPPPPERDEPRPRRDHYDDPPPRPPDNTIVIWVAVAVGGASLLIILICGGMAWYATRQVGRGVNRVIQKAQERPPPVVVPIRTHHEALVAVGSGDPRQRQRGAEWFSAQAPDEMWRAAVLNALQPLQNDADAAVRHHARVAANRWR